MEKFVELMDEFLLNYSNYNDGKHEFDCEYGEIIFFKNSKKKDIIIVHGIYIYPEYRNKGFCKNILIHLIDKCSKTFQYLCIQSVISKILYEYLLRFKYKNKKFKKTLYGFVFKIK
jgi:RimJ/RimL family protein N-acetyltransferase